MRTIFFLFMAVLFSTAIFANTITAVTPTLSPGDWSSNATWDSGTVPQSGDVVVVPLGKAVSVATQVYPSTTPTLTILITGTLYFHPSGKLDLSASSYIWLAPGAQIIPQNSSASQLINIGGVTKYNASNNGTITGPVYASAATGASSSGQALSGWSAGVLPIRLTSFTAQVINNTILLNWITAEEVNTDHFELERSTDGGSRWTTFYQLKTKGKASAYTTTDNTNLTGTILYRLKTVDIDNRYTYSAIVKVRTDKVASVFISPNPATSFINVAINHLLNQNTAISIINTAGQIVKQMEIPAASNFITLSTQGLTKGIYTVVVFRKNEILDSQSLLIQ